MCVCVCVISGDDDDDDDDIDDGGDDKWYIYYLQVRLPVLSQSLDVTVRIVSTNHYYVMVYMIVMMCLMRTTQMPDVQVIKYTCLCTLIAPPVAAPVQWSLVISWPLYIAGM